jgi:hypothetical protein
VALSNSTYPNERANWLITGSDDVDGTGTLLATYPAIDEYGHPVIYQVDIMLNSQNGAKIASLQPGVENKKVSVDYGVQYLYYHYWYSDPNSTSNQIEDIGWAETPDIVINEMHQEAEIEIPVYYSNVGKYGTLTVVNENDFVVNVYADDNLIEDIAMVDGSSQSLSSIPSNSQTSFLIPVDKYKITTKDLGNKLIDEFSNVQIVQDEDAVLRTGVVNKGIRITNNTDLTIGLFTIEEEYLGLTIEPGKTSPTYVIPNMYDTLKVIDFARTGSKGFAYSSSVTINELDNYLTNDLTFISTWSEIAENVFESPSISNFGSTSMEAELENFETVVLTFDYNVSSEEGYDNFSFIVDNFVEIDEASGETGWVTFSMSMEPGLHTLQWLYEKDQSQSEGRDNVQIRNISIQ